MKENDKTSFVRICITDVVFIASPSRTAAVRSAYFHRSQQTLDERQVNVQWVSLFSTSTRPYKQEQVTRTKKHFLFEFAV